MLLSLQDSPKVYLEHMHFHPGLDKKTNKQAKKQIKDNNTEINL